MPNTNTLIAHRGGVVDQERSENSFKALEEAIRRGYTHVEIDTRITADGHVICFHNDELMEEAGIDGRISAMTKDAVTQVVLTRSGERIPTFEEYCAHCANRIGVMIDLKGCREEFIVSYSDEIQAALEYVSMVYHGYHVTHLDSTAHFFWNGQMYNGRPSSLVSTNRGATVGSIDNARNGIVGRGVLVDVPLIRGVDWLDRDEAVMPEDILAAEERCGFKIEPGDILLIRTGQLKRTRAEGPFNPAVDGSTACQAACLPLMRERDIAVLGTDTSNDVMPAPYPKVRNPIHQVALIRMGVWILDNANLEELAVACAERNRWEFMLSMGPLRIVGGTGCPVNPIAIF